MSKVIRCVYKYGGISGAERYSCQERPYPMYRRHAGPSKPQLSNRGQNSSDANDTDHGFGRHFPSFGVLLMRVDHSSKQWLGDDNKKTPYRDFRVSISTRA